MKVIALSDLHGHFPSDLPDADVCIIAGDIVDFNPADQTNLKAQLLSFRDWLTDLWHGRKILPIGIAGNHDFVFQDMPNVARKMPWIYLEDSGWELRGKRFWGSPWQPWMGSWAFNAPEHHQEEEMFLRSKFMLVPDDTDVLITHTPPAGFHDTVGKAHVGSIALNQRIEQVRPTLSVYGHVHKPGVEQIDGVTLCNASYVGFNRRPLRRPVQLFEL